MKIFYTLATTFYSLGAFFMYMTAILQCVVYSVILGYTDVQEAVDVYIVSYIVTTIGLIVIDIFLRIGNKNYRPPEYQYLPTCKSEYQKNSIFGCVGAVIGIGMVSYQLAFTVDCLKSVKALLQVYEVYGSTDEYSSEETILKASKFVDIFALACFVALIISEIIQIVKRSKMPESEFVRKPQVQQNIIYTTVQQPMQQPYPQYQGQMQGYQQGYQQPQYQQQQMQQQQMYQQQPQQSYQSNTNQQDNNVTVASVKTVNQRDNNIL